MSMEITTRICDIQDQEHSEIVGEITTFVIFDHDQEDGKSRVNPYSETQTLDICTYCRNEVRKGKVIYAHGAMGFNKYWLKSLE